MGGPGSNLVDRIAQTHQCQEISDNPVYKTHKLSTPFIPRPSAPPNQPTLPVEYGPLPHPSRSFIAGRVGDHSPILAISTLSNNRCPILPAASSREGWETTPPPFSPSQPSPKIVAPSFLQFYRGKGGRPQISAVDHHIFPNEPRGRIQPQCHADSFGFIIPAISIS
jgi:hypothetical protein